jgi:hypothetical protein
MMGVMQASQTKTYADTYDFAENVQLEDTVKTVAHLASTIPTSEINPNYSHFEKTINEFYKNPQIAQNDTFFVQACNDLYAHQWLIKKVSALPSKQIEETYNNLLKIRSAFTAVRPPKGCVNAVTHGISLLQPYVASHGIRNDDLHSPFQTILKSICCYPTSKKLS